MLAKQRGRMVMEGVVGGRGDDEVGGVVEEGVGDGEVGDGVGEGGDVGREGVVGWGEKRRGGVLGGGWGIEDLGLVG
ncbi:hypothetical protein, partial [Dermacoccus nishinomiyaensis]|uniref:hypothetical protein n=1 Tax=Dermacoccus nishinomiyaensis TaxID=1274 RepID=UPI001C93025F